MNKVQALYVARKLVDYAAKKDFFTPHDEQEFEKETGVTNAQAINALPIIAALETVAGAEE